jgi:hypothetical protein
MQTILLSHEEVAHRAKQMYESGIRQQVNSEDNIGKMVIIDINSLEWSRAKSSCTCNGEETFTWNEIARKP